MSLEAARVSIPQASDGRSVSIDWLFTSIADSLKARMGPPFRRFQVFHRDVVVPSRNLQNPFHDTASAVATVIYTNALRPRTAVVLSDSCSAVSVAHGSTDGQKGGGLIMLILIGLLPARFALNPDYGPEQVDQAIEAAGRPAGGASPRR